MNEAAAPRPPILEDLMTSLPPMPIRIRHQTRLRLLQVARVEQLSPRMKRIVLGGAELEGFVTASPGDHVKLFFPGPGQIKPILPTLGPDGRADLAGAIPSAMRDYTPRRFDSAQQELTIDFVLHGTGIASIWAERAQPGDWIGVGGPRGSVLAPEADTTLLAGDETALPAISRFLEEMQPGARAFAFIEVADAREQRHIPTAANAAITWLPRNGLPPGTDTLLVPALRALTLSSGSIFAWLAGEIEVVRTLRRVLTEEAGLSRSQIRAAGYWRIGAQGEHTRIDD